MGPGFALTSWLKSPKPKCETCHSDPNHAVALDGGLHISISMIPTDLPTCSTPVH